MDSPAHPQFRLAAASDAEAVAALHADSWRRHYRGLYSAAFLDGEVAADRNVVTRPFQNNNTQHWRLTNVGGNVYTIAQVSSGRFLAAHENPKLKFPRCHAPIAEQRHTALAPLRFRR